MRIIRLGNNPEDCVHRATCRTCYTEIEFHQSEAKYVDDWRDGDFLSVDCPVCKSQITKSVGRKVWRE